MSKSKSIKKDKKAFQLTGKTWNAFIENDHINKDDIDDFRYHIHQLQRILYTNIYIKKHGIH